MRQSKGDGRSGGPPALPKPGIEDIVMLGPKRP
jgi:hypothetical protein